MLSITPRAQEGKSLAQELEERLLIKEETAKRQKQRLYEEWSEKVYNKINGPINERDSKALNLHKQEAYQHFLDTANKKGCLFRDIIIESEYDPLHENKAIQHCTRVDDPCCRVIKHREEEVWLKVLDDSMEPHGNGVTLVLGRCDNLDTKLWASGIFEATPYGYFNKMMASTISAESSKTYESRVKFDHYDIEKGVGTLNKEFPKGKQTTFNGVSGLKSKDQVRLVASKSGSHLESSTAKKLNGSNVYDDSSDDDNGSDGSSSSSSGGDDDDEGESASGSDGNDEGEVDDKATTSTTAITFDSLICFSRRSDRPVYHVRYSTPSKIRLSTHFELENNTGLDTLVETVLPSSSLKRKRSSSSKKESKKSKRSSHHRSHRSSENRREDDEGDEERYVKPPRDEKTQKVEKKLDPPIPSSPGPKPVPKVAEEMPPLHDKTSVKSEESPIPDEQDTHVLCSMCKKSYDMSLLDPPLLKKPQGEWKCFECLSSSKSSKSHHSSSSKKKSSRKHRSSSSHSYPDEYKHLLNLYHTRKRQRDVALADSLAAGMPPPPWHDQHLAESHGSLQGLPNGSGWRVVSASVADLRDLLATKFSGVGSMAAQRLKGRLIQILKAGEAMEEEVRRLRLQQEQQLIVCAALVTRMIQEEKATWAMFKGDMARIWANCKLYNSEGAVIVEYANELEKTYLGLMEETPTQATNLIKLVVRVRCCNSDNTKDGPYDDHYQHNPETEQSTEESTDPTPQNDCRIVIIIVWFVQFVVRR
ncbi:hypothetical protein DYB32_004553 [Aphanomyces invadans]|uniref:Bromo domain-containing protein n=1 Tax=Aphanomyces invadans TaxID=157072 RepID=A0A418AX95_9STRA|nr:hypothetical protein DYB32_004553 [Aphanomyces invadans]